MGGNPRMPYLIRVLKCAANSYRSFRPQSAVNQKDNIGQSVKIVETNSTRIWYYDATGDILPPDNDKFNNYNI